MLRTIERPTYATLRPCEHGGVHHLLDAMHVRGEAGDDDPLRCCVWNTRSSTGPMSRSDVVKPGTSALVESTRNRSTPSSPSRANGAQVGDAAVERQLVHLEVAGVQQQAGAGPDGDGQRVGDRVVDRDELEVERTERDAGRPP